MSEYSYLLGLEYKEGECLYYNPKEDSIITSRVKPCSSVKLDKDADVRVIVRSIKNIRRAYTMGFQDGCEI